MPFFSNTTPQATADARVTSLRPTAFGLFGHLPLELQDLIWEFASIQDPPRVFQWRNDFLVANEPSVPQYIQATHFHAAPGSQHPVTQQVCFRAREAARRTGLRSLRKPAERVSWDWTAQLMAGMYGRHFQAALPLSSVEGEGEHLLFNIDRDILYILDPQRDLPEATPVRPKESTTGGATPELPQMSLTDARHVAVGLPGRYIHTFIENDWAPTVRALRDTFRNMQTLYLVYERHHTATVDSVTGEERDSPWVRDGSCAGGERYERRAAPVTALLPATDDQRACQDWASVESTVREAWARVSPGAEGATTGAEKPVELRIEVRYTERDWTSRPRGPGGAEVRQTSVQQQEEEEEMSPEARRMATDRINRYWLASGFKRMSRAGIMRGLEVEEVH